jgi:hypothetical protein
MFANLVIANMSFDDWADKDAGLQDDGTYNWIGPWPMTESHLQIQKKTVAKRDVCLKAAKALGHIY